MSDFNPDYIEGEELLVARLKDSTILRSVRAFGQEAKAESAVMKHPAAYVYFRGDNYSAPFNIGSPRRQQGTARWGVTLTGPTAKERTGGRLRKDGVYAASQDVIRLLNGFDLFGCPLWLEERLLTDDNPELTMIRLFFTHEIVLIEGE